MPIKYDIPDNYLNEYVKYYELFILGSIQRGLITSGNFVSTTSSVEYIYTDGNDLYSQLKIAIGDYLVVANDFNNKLETTDLSPLYSKSYNNEKAINELLMIAEIDSKVIGDNNLGKFYTKAGETFSYSSGNIDFTKAYCSSATQGTNTINIDRMKVGLITDFKVGQEVTLQDSSNKEDLTISNIVSSTLTFTNNISNSYSGAVNIYRSNIEESEGAYKFSELSLQDDYDKTSIPIITPSGYVSGSTNARNLVRLDSGNFYMGLMNTATSTSWYIYKSADNFSTQASQFKTGSKTTNDDISIATDGTYVYALVTQNTSVIFYKWLEDGTLVNSETLDSSLTNCRECSLASNSNGGVFAVWVCTDSTYPNSLNVKFAKSVDYGETFESATNITTDNTSGLINTHPYIGLLSDGNPLVVCEFENGTANYQIRSAKWGGVSWIIDAIDTQTNILYRGNLPNFVVKSNGNIDLVWYSKDSTHTSVYNIRHKESVDLAVSWSSTYSITSGNVYNQTNPTVTCDLNDNLYVLWQGTGVGYASNDRIKKIKNDGVWGAEEEISGFISSINFPTACENFRDFSNPITIWGASGGVRLYGAWTVEYTSNVLTSVDIRFNITPKIDSENLSAFLFYNDNFSGIVASASIVDSTANETYSSMTNESIVTLGSNNNERADIMSVTTPEDKVTLKYEISRALVSDDARLIKLYGGID